MSHTELLAAIAAFGLPNASTAIPSVPLAPAPWRRLMEGTASARLSGHLVEAIDAEAFAVTADQARQATELHRKLTWRVLGLERRLLEVAGLLSTLGIDMRVLKGPALARTCYPKVSSRTFADIDVLVPADRFDEAAAGLAVAGCARPFPQLREGFDRRFGKNATFVGLDGLQVDVHRTFVVGPYGLMITLEDLFATHESFALGGRMLKALGTEEQFLNACYHAALGDVPPQLSALRDVAQILLGAKLEVDRARRLAEAWRGTAVLARAVALTWRTLRLSEEPPLAVWARGFTPTRWDRRLLACYVSANRSNSLKYLASARVIPGTGAKLAYLRGLLLPDRAFLARRRVAYGAWWHHGAMGLLGREPKR